LRAEVETQNALPGGRHSTARIPQFGRAMRVQTSRSRATVSAAHFSNLVDVDLAIDIDPTASRKILAAAISRKRFAVVAAANDLVMVNLRKHTAGSSMPFE
jgi:hypothetical protein